LLWAGQRDAAMEYLGHVARHPKAITALCKVARDEWYRMQGQSTPLPQAPWRPAHKGQSALARAFSVDVVALILDTIDPQSAWRPFDRDLAHDPAADRKAYGLFIARTVMYGPKVVRTLRHPLPDEYLAHLARVAEMVKERAAAAGIAPPQLHDAFSMSQEFLTA
jgi:hypothetical protein